MLGGEPRTGDVGPVAAASSQARLLAQLARTNKSRKKNTGYVYSIQRDEHFTCSCTSAWRSVTSPVDSVGV